MPRPATGSIRTAKLSDGTAVYRLRFQVAGVRELVVLHERPNCGCSCGGGWDAAAARTELGNIQARIRAGVWKRPEPPPTLVTPEGGGERVPTFHEYASWWLQAKVDGVLGRKPLSESTATDYRWRLRCHLLPFFAKYRLDQIDRDLCLAFKAQKLREAKELRDALHAGADMRDRLGRRAVPLSPASMRKLLDCLAGILDEAVEDGHIESNPARGRRMRVHVPKPSRTFLEMDELAALIDAAGEQDVQLGPSAPISEAVGPTAALVAHLLAQGKRSSQIADELGIAKSTVSFHVGRIGAHVGRGYIGRRVVVEILGRSGVRASELCDMKVGHVRLHDPDGARFQIPDSKTETGIREVQMSPDLVAAVVAHLDRLRRIGVPTGPDDYLVPNSRGGRMDRQRVGKIVKEAASAATERLQARGMPPLPNTTPHTLRRTYISIALIANNFDVKWVMGQVGHADSKMTMDVYAHLEQRVKRDHGTNFDRLLRAARDDLADASSSRLSPRPAPPPAAIRRAGSARPAQLTLDVDGRSLGPSPLVQK